MSDWKDCGDYWLHSAAQGTQEWLNARKFRVTSSVIYSFVFPVVYGNTILSEPEEVLNQIATGEAKKFDSFSKANMRRGNRLEPKVRKRYEKLNNVTVLELGLAVPKWNPYIAGSTDGDVEGTEGLIEIKCVMKLSKAILEVMKRFEKTGKIPNNYDHIPPAHLFQMMTCMKILGKKWCDYIAYSEFEKKEFVQRVFFSEEKWEEFYSLLTRKIRTLKKKLVFQPEIPEAS